MQSSHLEKNSEKKFISLFAKKKNSLYASILDLVFSYLNFSNSTFNLFQTFFQDLGLKQDKISIELQQFDILLIDIIPAAAPKSSM